MGVAGLVRWLAVALFALLGVAGTAARAEDGYDLWLRYRPLPGSHATAITVRGDLPTVRAAAAELERGLSGLAGAPVVQSQAPTTGGVLLADTRDPKVAALRLPV